MDYTNGPFEDHDRWYGYSYTFEELPIMLEDTVVDVVKMISPIPESPERIFTMVWRSNEGLGVRQPATSKGKRKSPHEDLQRLDINDDNSILEFVNTWGLLGLWDVDCYSNWSPFFTGEFKHWFGKAGWRNRKEPLEVFKKAAYHYQRWFDAIVRFGLAENGKERNHLKWQISIDFDTESEYGIAPGGFMLRTGGINPVPLWDEAKQTWYFGWSYRSLLHAIYFATFLDLTERRDKTGGYRMCMNDYCRLPFLATRSTQKFCSKTCEKAQTMRNLRKKANV